MAAQSQASLMRSQAAAANGDKHITQSSDFADASELIWGQGGRGLGYSGLGRAWSRPGEDLNSEMYTPDLIPYFSVCSSPTLS